MRSMPVGSADVFWAGQLPHSTTCIQHSWIVVYLVQRGPVSTLSSRHADVVTADA